MASVILPPQLLKFLAQKTPQVCSRSYFGGDLTLELVAERDFDSMVGVLRLSQVSLYHVADAESLCGVVLGTIDDVPEELRKEVDESRGRAGGQVLIFEAANGQPYYCIAGGLEFSLRPWFDLALTERVRRLNAERGYPASEAVRSHFAASASELLGKEIVCLRCLHRFLYRKEFMDCPSCSFPASPFFVTPEGLLRYFLGQVLYEKSGCEPLQRKTGAVECYRLNLYSYWLDHRIIEVERTPASVRLMAKAWCWQEGRWVETADRALSPAEWRRFSRLVQLAPFWELPPEGGHHGMDGADYILEGMREGCYHYVRRWSPDPSADQENFWFACEYLHELATQQAQDAAG
jgi:hypothetical protein